MGFNPHARRFATARARGLAAGYRSGLEEKLAAQLQDQGLPVHFEAMTISYAVPERKARYTPDFPFKWNGIIIESKGKFETADRQKHILVKDQHPDLDIRFVFSRSSSPIRKGSPTTYADWCIRYGFKFADKLIPQAWIDEPANDHRIAAMERWLKEKNA